LPLITIALRDAFQNRYKFPIAWAQGNETLVYLISLADIGLPAVALARRKLHNAGLSSTAAIEKRLAASRLRKFQFHTFATI
jgi:hypothetical protein